MHNVGMSLPLKDNPRHVAWLCEQLGLGRAGGALAPVSGGLHHRMWRLDTSKGSFAVKQLGLERELAHLDVAGHYNATEAAAAAFAAAGIPALHALSSSDYLQQIDDEAYLVYPWTEARAVGRNRIPPEQAAQVAVLMAKMHRAGVDVPGLEQSRPNWLSSERLAALLQGAMFPRAVRRWSRSFSWIITDVAGLRSGQFNRKRNETETVRTKTSQTETKRNGFILLL